MRTLIDNLLQRIRRAAETGEGLARARAVESIEAEVRELENIFGLLVLGFIVGIPSPPIHISLELAPLMEEELISMIRHVDTSSEAISHLFSTFDIG